MGIQPGCARVCHLSVKEFILIACLKLALALLVRFLLSFCILLGTPTPPGPNFLLGGCGGWWGSFSPGWIPSTPSAAPQRTCSLCLYQLHLPEDARACKRAGIQASCSSACMVFLCVFIFLTKLYHCNTNDLLMLTEDKILISVQPEAIMIYSVLSSSFIERYVI